MQCRTDPIRSGRDGFTLVEILVVVVILGVLAAVTVPRLTGIVRDVSVQAAEINRAQLQRAVVRYHQDHGQYPAVDDFHDQITLASNRKGETAEIGTDGYPFGPYLLVVPANPLSGGNTVGESAPGTSDWFYDSHAGRVLDNHLDSNERQEIAQQLRPLIGAVLGYAKDHGRTLPGSLQELVGPYLSEQDLAQYLKHPVTGEIPAFTLRLGDISLNDLDDLATTPILQEMRYGRILAGGVTAYADGHVN